MIEYNMSIVSGISDRITVLQRGSAIAEGNYREVLSLPEVLDAYVGSVEQE
ncbi:hypothetical protein [Paraburkholderia caribensis]|uniref:hypothetical protein n=1 Tax=Paraburkholderia caribensis TaxID=75105 RepID=UPI001C6291F6|nr:hypothetical protein [Paraburkholderia caribensis]